MEKHNLEYKREWKDDYLKWICGFANANGGKLYIGIDDDGKVYGLQNAQKLLEDLPNKIVNYLGIIAEVNLLGHYPDNYLEIIISPSDVPVSYKGIYHLRSGSTKQELKGSALTQFLLKKAGKTWDDLVCEGAEFEDIDNAALQYFIKKATVSKRVADDIQNDTLQVILENLNLLTPDNKLKNAAILLFGKRPMRFIPEVQFKIGRFIDGDDDLRFQDVIEGNILEMANKVMEVLKSKYLISPISYQGLQRIETLEIPEDALREAIFNSIIHKDYTGTSIQLSVYNDKLILWNEGRLPENFTIETLLGKHPSKPFNRNIANVFFKSGFIEAWGRGVTRILNDFRKAGLPDPYFEEAMGGIMVTIYRNSEDVGKGVGKGVGKDVGKELTKLQSSILYAMRKDNIVTIDDLAENLNVTTRTIERTIDKLKQLNKIERIGGRKNGYWKILE